MPALREFPATVSETTTSRVYNQLGAISSSGEWHETMSSLLAYKKAMEEKVSQLEQQLKARNHQVTRATSKDTSFSTIEPKRAATDAEVHARTQAQVSTGIENVEYSAPPTSQCNASVPPVGEGVANGQTNIQTSPAGISDLQEAKSKAAVTDALSDEAVEELAHKRSYRFEELVKRNANHVNAEVAQQFCHDIKRQGYAIVCLPDKLNPAGTFATTYGTIDRFFKLPGETKSEYGCVSGHGYVQDAEQGLESFHVKSWYG